MNGVKSVTHLSDDRRQWRANILERVPDRRVAWAATLRAQLEASGPTVLALTDMTDNVLLPSRGSCARSCEVSPA
jgi:hypothetical protein